MCGEPRVAAECTCTERESGRCSRPTVRPGRNVNDEHDHGEPLLHPPARPVDERLADRDPRPRLAVFAGTVRRVGGPAHEPMPAGRDYGIQGPDWTPVDPRIMSASANIRYTSLNDWIVVRGRIVLGRNRVGMEEYRNLCQTLITRPEFRGADFSPGDRYISDCAAGSVSPGTPGVWRRHPPAVFKMESTRPPGFPGNPPARMPRAPTPARSPPPRPLRRGEMTFRPTHDVGPRTQCISGLNPAAYGLPVNASRPGSPQAHASLGSGWRPTLAGGTVNLTSPGQNEAS